VPAARRPNTGAALALVRSVVDERSPVEVVALAATAATPVALFLDYRAHTDFAARSVIYAPVGENAGRPATYEQIFGLTQALWIGAAIAVLALGGWRKFVDNAQLLFLVLALAVLVVATAAYEQVDSTTVLTLGATMVAYIAMMGVIRHVDVRLPTTRDLVTTACAAGAAIVVLTAAKHALAHTLSQRLGVFAFGDGPETAVVLAPLLVLVPAMRVPRYVKFGTAVCLGAGLVLTQTRGASIAAVVGGVVLAATQKGRHFRIGALTAIGAAAAAYAVLARRSFSFSDVATTYRRENLQYHWDLFVQRPSFGHGISETSIDAVRAAHNTLLSIADAGGAVLLTLWIAVWIVLPLTALLDRRRRFATASVGLAATAAVIVGWSTTGSEVLLYDPPTNLLPLMLAVALVGPAAFESLPGRASASPHRSRNAAAGIAFAAAGLIAVLVALSSAAGIIGRSGSPPVMTADLRARAIAASQALAFSSCGHCRVASLRAVTSELAEATFTPPPSNLPGQCLFIAPRSYRPVTPGLPPPGVSWQRCRATGAEVARSTRDWLASQRVSTAARRRARLSVSRWLATRCTRSCLGTIDPLTATVWKVRTRSGSLVPSPCFYAIFDRRSPLATLPQTFGRAFVSCAVD
jgi:hypothetical protein